ncbi:hypothetical protein A2U01_0052668, partial [Trifolium medium]|nr:hypothetical protein [Trifolium medium]
VSTKNLMSEVINLDDNSDNGVSVFVPGRVDLNCDKVSYAKRNLLAAFSEYDDAPTSTSKINKPSQD